MATAVLGRALQFASVIFLRSGRARSALGSDVVSVSQTGHLEATDYVGQASRRYQYPAARLSGNDSITFSGRNKTLVLPIAVLRPQMLVWSH